MLQTDERCRQVPSAKPHAMLPPVIREQETRTKHGLTVQESTALWDNAALPEYPTKHGVTPRGSAASGGDEARRHGSPATVSSSRQEPQRHHLQADGRHTRP